MATEKFEVRNRWTNAVQFTADIECDPDAAYGWKLRLAVSWAISAGIALSGLNLDRVDFTSFEAKACRFDDSTFVRSTFVGSRFDDSTFVRSTFVGSTFDGSRFDDSTFVRSTFVGSRFDDSTFVRSTFVGSTFDGSRFVGSTFVGSTFDGSRFVGSTFDGSRFVGSRFVRSTFVRSTFVGSRFVGSTFDGSTFDDSRFVRSRFDGSTFDGSRFVGSRFVRSTFADSTFVGELQAKADFIEILSGASPEVPGLIAALRAGRVDGSTYTGECACLVGTIANVRGVDVDTLEKNSGRPAERWFLMISKGDKPGDSSPGGYAAGRALEWALEYCANNGIALTDEQAA